MEEVEVVVAVVAEEKMMIWPMRGAGTGVRAVEIGLSLVGQKLQMQ